MPEIKWTEGFSVGVPLMDEQHQRLIALINATNGRPDERGMEENIKALFAYADLHFHEEEKLLRDKRYPELGNQLREHAHFLKKAADFAARVSRDPNVCEQLNAFLCGWLSRHILEVDMKYKHFLLPVRK